MVGKNFGSSPIYSLRMWVNGCNVDHYPATVPTQLDSLNSGVLWRRIRHCATYSLRHFGKLSSRRTKVECSSNGYGSRLLGTIPFSDFTRASARLRRTRRSILCSRPHLTGYRTFGVYADAVVTS